MKRDMRHNDFYPVVRPMPTPRCGDLLWSRIALNPSQVIQWSTLSTTVFFLSSFFPICEESPQVGAFLPYNVDHKKNTRIGEGKQHIRLETQQTHAHKPRCEHKTRRREFTTQMVLKPLTRWSEYVVAKSWRLRMFSECLMCCSTRLGVPFIAPR
jgi:hypothetical protein